MSPNKKLDTLTELVMEYKKTGDQLVLRKIYALTKRLVYRVFNYYGIIKGFPLDIQEDIEEDCRSLVLIKCLDRFDINKGAGFGTFYTWWCMSHTRARKNYYMFRKPLLNRMSLDGEVEGDSGGPLALKEIVSNFNENTLYNLKRHLVGGTLGAFDVYNDVDQAFEDRVINNPKKVVLPTIRCLACRKGISKKIEEENLGLCNECNTNLIFEDA